MPTPPAPELATLAKLDGVPPEHRHALGMAMGTAIARQLDTFVQQNQVLPGVPVAAPPPANTGTTVGPGRLVGIVSPRPVIEMDVQQATRSVGLDAGQAQTLNALLTEALSEALDALAQAQMQPGVSVAGGVTVSPGRLMAPMVSSLEAALPINLQKLNPASHIPAAPVMNQPGHVGLCLPTEPAKAVGELVGKAAKLFIQRVQVLPGIGVAVNVTAGPGILA